MSRQKQLELFKNEIYCLDASSIINLFRHRGLPYPPYASDVFEGLWKKLDELIKKEVIISHSTVLKEIEERDDEAKRWCHKYKKIFKDIDEDQIQQIDNIKKKYSKSHWDAETNRKGQEWADPWVISLAICKDAKIVTDEKDEADRIPFVAKHFGIASLNLMDFFREVGIKL